jgi:hypothetical protein
MKTAKAINKLLKQSGNLFLFRPISGTMQEEKLKVYQVKTQKGILFALVEIPPWLSHERTSIRWVDATNCRISEYYA